MGVICFKPRGNHDINASRTYPEAMTFYVDGALNHAKVCYSSETALYPTLHLYYFIAPRSYAGPAMNGR